MSQSGELVVYTIDELADPHSSIQSVLTLSGCQLIVAASRTRGLEQSWQAFQRSTQNTSTQPSDEEQPTVSDFEDLELEDPSDFRSISQLYVPGTCLLLWIGRCPLGDRLAESIQREVPKSLRGDFVPSEVALYTGWHDVYECSETHHGILYARAFCSLRFWGYSSPNDWGRTRSMISSSPAVMDLSNFLEGALGRVDHCIYWNI
jgi:hypothetical protein